MQGPDWDTPVLRPGKLLLYSLDYTCLGPASRATALENVRWPFGPRTDHSQSTLQAKLTSLVVDSHHHCLLTLLRPLLT